MSQTIFTGWKTVTPGECFTCGFSEDWECDGRGTIYCSCQCCPECGAFDGGHYVGCTDSSLLA